MSFLKWLCCFTFLPMAFLFLHILKHMFFSVFLTVAILVGIKQDHIWGAFPWWLLMHIGHLYNFLGKMFLGPLPMSYLSFEYWVITDFILNNVFCLHVPYQIQDWQMCVLICEISLPFSMVPFEAQMYLMLMMFNVSTFSVLCFHSSACV